MHNSEVNDGKKISWGSNMLMTNGGDRETYPSLISTTLLHNGYGKANSDDVYKEHE